MTSKRSVGDWIWMGIGIAGVACIGLAIWMLLDRPEPRTPEQAMRERAEKADAHWKAGREKLEAGEAEAAVTEIESAIELVDPRNPVMPVLRNDLGKALAAAGRSDEAARQFSVAFSLQPTFFDPYLQLGRILEAKGQHAPAWQFHRAALALHPEPVPASLGETVASLGASIREARDEEVAKYRAEWKANPANVEALTVLIMAELLDTKVPADAPPDAAIRAALLAAGAGVEGLADLLVAQEAAVADRPGSVVDRAGLGNVLLLSGEWERAAEVLGQAVDLSGSDPAARNGLALVALLTGAEGEAAAEEAAKRLTASPLAWLTLGAARVAHGKPEEAQAPLSNALRLNPALPEVYRLLAQAMTGEKNAENRAAAARAYARLLE